MCFGIWGLSVCPATSSPRRNKPASPNIKLHVTAAAYVKSGFKVPPVAAAGGLGHYPYIYLKHKSYRIPRYTENGRFRKYQQTHVPGKGANLQPKKATMKPLKLSICLPILFVVSVCTYGQTPSYSKQIQPLFNKYCTECHNTKKPRAGLDLQSAKGWQAGSDNGSVITPGKADDSLLVLVTEKKKKPIMPPKNKPQPTAAEVQLIRAWVAAGAKVDKAVTRVVLPAIRSKVKTEPPVGAMAFHPDGKRLFFGTYGVLGMLVAEKQNLLAEFTGVTGKVTALTVSPDGKLLAVSSGTPGIPSLLRIYTVPEKADDVTNWPRAVQSLNAHDDIIHQIAFSPDSKTLISVGYDKKVKLWDVSSLQKPWQQWQDSILKNPKVLNEHSDSVYGITFSPDGKLFATAAADRAVKVWRTEGTKLLYTLGESTDWVYAVAWSPDGKHLAAAGVDKSIRVWKLDASEGEVEHSVFAHTAPVVKLVYGKDGKTLYSVAEDGTVKAWDARKMVETKVYDRQPETVLSLELSPDQKQLVLGRFDGHLVFVDTKTGKQTADLTPAKLRELNEVEPNNSPGRGQPVTVPGSVKGKVRKAGDIDYYRFRVRTGQELGVKVEAIKSVVVNKLVPHLILTTASGQVLTQSDSGFLGYKFSKAGTYSIGVRDREYNGSILMNYKLEFGDIPVVTSVFPLGLQQGKKAAISVNGVHLNNPKVWVDAKGKGAGQRLPVPVSSAFGKPMGTKSVVVGEFSEVIETSDSVMSMSVPGTANGRISSPNETDVWKFSAKKGQKLIIEVNAIRLGSELDSYVEILDGKGVPVERAVLRSLAQTYVTFRDHNSKQGNIRIEAWSELAVNDYIYCGTELMKILALPTHPDADCNFFRVKNQRTGYLDTTPTYHTKGEPMYKVSIHPPGTVFPPNGFPVVTLFYRNDDGPAGFDRDSQLTFTVPRDGEYQVRIGDSRGQGGDNFGYRLTVRHPRPNYTIRVSPTNPEVWKGGAVPITVTADRIDGFMGPIAITPENLPKGFEAPATNIPAGEYATTFALWANADAKTPGKMPPVKLSASADINGKKVTQSTNLGKPKAVSAKDIVTTTNLSEVSLKPGGKSKLIVTIKRGKKFKARVPIEVQGLPHGVKVLDIGLNGILITEKETQRTMVLYCEPWVQPMNQPIVVTARNERANQRYSARSVLLKIGSKK